MRYQCNSTSPPTRPAAAPVLHHPAAPSQSAAAETAQVPWHWCVCAPTYWWPSTARPCLAAQDAVAVAQIFIEVWLGVGNPCGLIGYSPPCVRCHTDCRAEELNNNLPTPLQQKRYCHAVHHCRYFDHSLVAGFGYLVHAGWVYPYLARRRNHFCPVARHQLMVPRHMARGS